jgi:hypothetical protein
MTSGYYYFLSLRFLKFFPLLLFLLFFQGCGMGHHHKGFSLIKNPALEMFGAKLENKDDVYSVESYFQSSVYFKSEYIYENLDLKVQKNLEINKEYPLSELRIIRYARGGQAGQITTGQATGTFKILEMDNERLKISINAAFENFKKEGAMGIPGKPVRRQGILTALKGYELY